MLNTVIAPPLEEGFKTLNLIEPLCRALHSEGYSTPTPIQHQAIPHLLDGRDILGCAQTGTGKTAAFALPLLQRLAANRKHPGRRGVRSLILAPTRELAVQIEESFRVYGRHLKMHRALVFGGVKQGPQVKALSRGVDILVATPGRLLDLFNQGFLRLDTIDVLVLDEADRMLDMGFLPDIRKIVAEIPRDRQTMLFSATMSKEIAQLAQKFLIDPVKVSVTPPSSTVDKIDQRILFVDRENKGALLESFLMGEADSRALIFTKTKHGANRVASQLAKKRIHAGTIHGNKSQAARLQALESFRSGKARVLVATDIAARGLDIDGITHVINYDLPMEAESYVHRIGRTARAGAVGVALSFCDAGDRTYLRRIEKQIDRPVSVDSSHPYHSAKVEAHEDSKGGGRRNGGKGKSFSRRSSRGASAKGSRAFSKNKRRG